MQWLGTITVVGLIALVALVVVFFRLRSKDLLADCLKRRSAGAKICSRADLVEGLERFPVALALTDDTLYYENNDLQASLELGRIDEVEYDDETSTGKAVVGKALRLRTHGQLFEFILDAQEARKWQAALPARRVDTRPTAQAV